jgi:sugar lactone lactonase YvrE
MSVRVALRLGAEIGEGPAWDAATGTLLMVDILRGVVHVYNPAAGSHRTIDVGQPVGAALPRSGGGAMLAVGSGFATLDLDSGAVELVAAVSSGPPGRMNDAKCDSAGRLWAGTTTFDTIPRAGALYRLDPGGTVTKMLAGVTLSNGLDWSPDDRTMYYVDSANPRIDAFDFDPVAGAIERRRMFAQIPAGWGTPDGLTVDAEGFVWVALWGGARVQRFAPDGRPDRTVPLPVPAVASCAVGGPDLATLYVTTARFGLTEAQLGAAPCSGDLFALEVAVRGVPARPFGG